jgi:hypothetical protein
VGQRGDGEWETDWGWGGNRIAWGRGKGVAGCSGRIKMIRSGRVRRYRSEDCGAEGEQGEWAGYEVRRWG